MKPIQLSEDQKYKIIEMTKALFPKYKSVHFINGGCDCCLEGTVRLSIYDEPTKHYGDWILIHSYELLHEHIEPQLYNLTGLRVLVDDPYHDSIEANYKIFEFYCARQMLTC